MSYIYLLLIVLAATLGCNKVQPKESAQLASLTIGQKPNGADSEKSKIFVKSDKNKVNTYSFSEIEDKENTISLAPGTYIIDAKIYDKKSTLIGETSTSSNSCPSITAKLKAGKNSVTIKICDPRDGSTQDIPGEDAQLNIDFENAAPALGSIESFRFSNSSFAHGLEYTAKKGRGPNAFDVHVTKIENFKSVDVNLYLLPKELAKLFSLPAHKLWEPGKGIDDPNLPLGDTIDSYYFKYASGEVKAESARPYKKQDKVVTKEVEALTKQLNTIIRQRVKEQLQN